MKNYWLERKNVAWKCTTLKFCPGWGDLQGRIEVTVELTDGRKFLCWPDEKRVMNCSYAPDMYVCNPGEMPHEKFNDDPLEGVIQLRWDIAEKIGYNVLRSVNAIDKNEGIEEYHKTVDLGIPGKNYYEMVI